jgi:hypothetical protein
VRHRVAVERTASAVAPSSMLDAPHATRVQWRDRWTRSPSCFLPGGPTILPSLTVNSGLEELAAGLSPAVADVPDRDAVRPRVRHRYRGRAAAPRRERSRSQAALYAVLRLPILFAADVSLLDTIDGSFMNFAHGCAFSRPVRKVFYTIVMIGLSVAIAMVISTIELAGLLAQK